MGVVSLSNNRKLTCIIPGCKAFRKIIFGDLKQLKMFLHQAHEHNELVKFAYDEGLISSKHGYVSHVWLLNKIAKLCVIRD